MRTFEIVSALVRHKKPVGWLIYDEEKRTGTIEIARDAQVGRVPAMFNHYLETGVFAIDETWTRMWIDERIPPESRHNINEILVCAGLKEYDPFALLFYTHGRSGQDDFYLRELVDGISEEASRYEYAIVSLQNSVGEKLAQARQNTGLTQHDLAYKTGIQQSVISKIESGKTNPTIETLACLADALGLQLDIEFRKV